MNMTNVVVQENSRKLLMMDILMSETCWAHKKWNKIASDIKFVFYSTITTMHGLINIRFNWKGFHTYGIQANQGTTPAFSWRDQGETTTNLKSGQLTYWPRSKPGNTPNIGLLLYIFTASHCLCYTPCPLTISPPCCLLHRLSLFNEVIDSYYADSVAVMHIFVTNTLNAIPMRSGM